VSALIPFDAIVIGTELGPVETLATSQRVREYCQDWDDPNPWYLTQSQFGGPVAPPASLAGLTSYQLLGSRYDARSTIGVQTSHRNLRPIPVGETLITRGRIADKYVDIWMEKANGVRPVIGTASATVPGAVSRLDSSTGSGHPEQAMPERTE
jgi:hypothetical protein